MPFTVEDMLEPATDGNGGGGKSPWVSLIELLAAMLPAGAGAVIGKYIDDVNERNAYTGKEAVSDAQGRYTGMENRLDTALRGETISPQLQRARSQAGATINRPITSPTPYNPYKSGFRLEDPVMLTNLLQMARGGNPLIQQNRNILQNSLMNRFGTRSMRRGNVPGTLTPYGQKTATGMGRR